MPLTVRRRSSSSSVPSWSSRTTNAGSAAVVQVDDRDGRVVDPLDAGHEAGDQVRAVALDADSSHRSPHGPALPGDVSEGDCRLCLRSRGHRPGRGWRSAGCRLGGQSRRTRSIGRQVRARRSPAGGRPGSPRWRRSNRCAAPRHSSGRRPRSSRPGRSPCGSARRASRRRCRPRPRNGSPGRSRSRRSCRRRGSGRSRRAEGDGGRARGVMVRTAHSGTSQASWPAWQRSWNATAPSARGASMMFWASPRHLGPPRQSFGSLMVCTS